MTFNSALTAGQLLKLRSDASTPRNWYGDLILSFCPNTAVLSARVNGAITAGSPYAQITFDTVTVGTYTDIVVDQVILISATNDLAAAYFRGRIRKTPTSTILYINETSISIADNDYIFVVDTYDLTDKLARPVGDPPVQYKDYDLAFIRPAPVVTGLQTAYLGESSGGFFRIAFSVAALAAEYGATISSYAFSFKASSYTVISGSLATAAVTIDFNANQWNWGHLTVTDSGGRTWTRHFAIIIDQFNEGLDNAQITREQSGHSVSITGFDGIDTSLVLDATFTVLATREYYNGVLGPIINNISFVGWLNHEEDDEKGDEDYSNLSEASFTVNGVGSEMARIEMQLLAIRLNNSPAVWDEIAALTPWRAIVHIMQRHSTVLNLCDLSIDDTGLTFEFPYISTQGGNLQAAVKGIADQTNSWFEYAPDGKLQFVRDGRYGSIAARAALTNVANWTTDDVLKITASIKHKEIIGKVDADGAFLPAVGQTAVALRSRAPGYAQGSAEGSQSLNNQILAQTSIQPNAISELNQRAGNAYSIANESIELTVVHGDGYHFLTPSMAQTYTFTLQASDATRGLAFDTSTKWFLKSIDWSQDNETGTRMPNCVYTNLTPIGDPGDNIPPIKEGEIPSFELPPLDPFPDFPAPEIGWLPEELPNPRAIEPPVGQIAFLDGNTLLFWDTAGDGLWVTPNYNKLRSPIWREITPDLASGYAVKCAMWDIFYNNAAIPTYALCIDTANSRVYYTGNGVAGDIVWVEGTAYAGAYSLMRPTSTRGTVMIYSPAPLAASVSLTYTNGSGPATANVGDTITMTSATVGADERIDVAFSSATQITITSAPNYINNGPPGPSNVFMGWQNPTGVTIGTLSDPPSISPTDFPAHTTIVNFGLDTGAASAPQFTLVVEIEAIASSGNATVRISTNYGATFGSPITVGAAPGLVGAFDVQYIGGVSVAGMTGKVRRATTIGGAYSDHTTYSTNPICTVVPWGRRNSTTADNLAVSTPDYLVAEANGTLWWVNGITAGKTNITPSGVTSCGSANAIRTWLGYKISYLGTVSGMVHEFDSDNGGATWTDNGAVADAVYIRGRRKRLSGKPDALADDQLYITGGAVLDFSSTNGVNLEARTKPSASGGGLDLVG